ncbi:MAG: nucleotide exchange factor GrpE [Thermodesulfovibrionales bacterium]|nr:nucleotide exchange factor GrpE [Thermodesulfovibrionales bacterium]
MQEREISENQLTSNKEETEEKGSEVVEELPVDEKERLTAELQELNDKYLRLYAEFENYKKRVNKDREELIKYGNESLLYELLPVIDNLEMALKHASSNVSAGLVQGVELTLKELQRTMEKYGVTPIEATGKPFDPLVHHAVTLVEREDIEEKIVVEEFRKGYMFRDKVLRPSLVAVSKKPQKTVNTHQSLVECQEKEKTEEEIKINKIIKEET